MEEVLPLCGVGQSTAGEGGRSITLGRWMGRWGGRPSSLHIPRYSSLPLFHLFYLPSASNPEPSIASSLHGVSRADKKEWNSSG